MKPVNVSKGGTVNVNGKTDKIVMDVPLYIRSLEWSREDAKNDAQLHRFTERAIKAQRKSKVLKMKHYNKLIRK